MGDLVTAHDAAEALGLPHAVVLVLIRTGSIEATRRGSLWLIESAEVERFRESMRGADDQPQPHPQCEVCQLLDVMTVDQVAQMLQCGRSLVLGLIHRKQLRAWPLGERGQWRIQRREVVRYIQGRIAPT